MGMAVWQSLLFSFWRERGCVAVVLVGPMAPSWAACGVNIKLISLSIERAPPLRNSCMQISSVM